MRSSSSTPIPTFPIEGEGVMHWSPCRGMTGAADCDSVPMGDAWLMGGVGRVLVGHSMSSPPMALWILGSHLSAIIDSIICSAVMTSSVNPRAITILGMKRGVRG